MRASRGFLTSCTALLASLLMLLAPMEQAAWASNTGLSCTDICSGAKASVESPNQTVIDRYCAIPDDSPLSDEEKKQAQKDCTDGLASAWPSVYPQCASMEIMGDSVPVQYTFGSLYAAMAITCAVAAGCCGQECEPVTSGLCTFGGLALTAGEIATLLIMSAVNNQKVKEVLQGNQWTSSLAGAAPAVLKGVAAVAKGGKGGGTSSTSTTTSTANTATDSAGSAAETGSGTSSNSGSKAASKAKAACYLSTIMSMLTYGGTSAAKFSSASSNAKTKQASCQAVEDNFSESYDYTRYAGLGESSTGSMGAIGTGASNQAAGSENKGGASDAMGVVGPTTEELISNPEMFNSAATAAIASDNSLKKLNELENLKNYPEMLKKSGVNLAAATAALKSGGTSAMFESVARDMGVTLSADQRAAVSQLAKIMDADARARAASITPRLTGGKKVGKSKDDAAFGFQFGGSAAGGLANPGGAMTFESAPPPAALPDSTDIWHEGDPRSIFQIVSNRVDRSRDRIDHFEWASPLNRALHGMPRLPDGAPLKPVADDPVATGGSKGP